MLEGKSPVSTPEKLINEFIAHPLLFNLLEQVTLLQKNARSQSAIVTLNLLLSFFEKILKKNSFDEKTPIEEHSINQEILFKCFHFFYLTIINIDTKYHLGFYTRLDILISNFPNFKNSNALELNSNITLKIVELTKNKNPNDSSNNPTIFRFSLNLNHDDIDEKRTEENLGRLCDSWHSARSNPESIHFIKIQKEIIEAEQQLFKKLLLQTAAEGIDQFDIFLNKAKGSDNSNNFTAIMKELLTTVSCWQSLRDPSGNQWQCCRRLLEILINHWQHVALTCEFNSWLDVLQKTNQIELNFYSSTAAQVYTDPLRFNGVEKLTKQRKNSVIDFRNKKPIREIQDELSLTYREILSEITSWAEAFLGPVPEEKYCLAIMGSNARGDVCLHSDIESVIFVSNNKSKKLLAYLKNFLKIIRWHNIFFMEFDERRSGFQFDAMPKIENIDGSDSVYIYDIKDALKTIQSTADEDGKLNFERYALYHLLHLAGDSNLLQQYREGLTTLPDLAVMGKKYLKYHYNDYKKFLDSNLLSKLETDPHFDLKKKLLQPITMICLDLALIYNLPPKFSDARDIIMELAKGPLAENFAITAIKHINNLHQLRFEAQKEGLRHEKLRDTIKFTPEIVSIIEETFVLLLKPLLLWTRWLVEGKTIPLNINPWEFPEENGARLSVDWANHRWEKTIAAMLVKNKTEIKAKRGSSSDNNSNTYLNPQFIAALIDAEILNENKKLKINVKKDQRDQQENIATITIKSENGQYLNLKLEFFPVAPEIALASSSFSHLLVGEGYLPRLELMRWEIDGKLYPVLISENIQGKSLQQFHVATTKPNLSQAVASIEDEAEWSSLDERSFSKAFLVDMITNPQYKTLGELVLVPTMNRPATLTSLAVQRKFYHANNENDTLVKDGIIETPIYFLANMRKEMELSVLQEFIHINPAALLSTWLGYLQVKYDEWIQLFQENKIKPSAESIVTLSSFLAEGVITYLYFKLSTIKSFLKIQNDPATSRISGNDLLKKQNKPTHLQILKLIYSDLSEYCGELLNNYHSLTERLDILAKNNKLKLIKPANFQVKIGTKKYLIENITSAINELFQAQDLYNKSNEIRNNLHTDQTKSSLEALKKFPALLRKTVLQQLQWQNFLPLYNKKFQAKILVIISATSFEELDLSNAALLTSEKLIEILKNSPGLRSLTIKNCQKLNLNKNVITALLAHKQLEEIVIDIGTDKEKTNAIILFFIFRAQQELYFKNHNHALFYYEEALKLGKSIYLVNRINWLRKELNSADEILGLPDDLNYSKLSTMPIWERLLAFDILVKILDQNNNSSFNLRQILEDAQDIPFVSLNLSGFSTILDDAIFKLLLKNSSEHLLDLNLQGCNLIKDESINDLKNYQQLEKLNLSNNNITTIKDILFPNLIELTISDCSLRGLVLNAPRLKVLSIVNCENLTNLTIGTQTLQKLTLIRCNQLSEKQFVALSGRMNHVVNLTIQGCRALKYSKFREAFPWLIRFPFNNFNSRYIASLTNLLNDIFNESANFPLAKELMQKIFAVVFEDISINCNTSFDTMVKTYNQINPLENHEKIKATILKNISSFGRISVEIVDMLTAALSDHRTVALAAIEGIRELFQNNDIKELDEYLAEKFNQIKISLDKLYRTSSDPEIIGAALTVLEDDISINDFQKLLLNDDEKLRELTLKILLQPKFAALLVNVVAAIISNLNSGDSHLKNYDVLATLAENSTSALTFLSEAFTHITDFGWQKKFIRVLGKTTLQEQRTIAAVTLQRILKQNVANLEIRIMATVELLKLTDPNKSSGLKNVAELLYILPNMSDALIELKIMLINALVSYRNAHISEKRLIITELQKILANAEQPILEIITIKAIIFIDGSFLKKYANEILEFLLSKELSVQQTTLEILADGKLLLDRPKKTEKIAKQIANWINSPTAGSHLLAINALEKIGHYIFKVEQVFEMLVDIFVYNFDSKIITTVFASLKKIALQVSPQHLMYLAQLLLSVLYDKKIKLDEVQRFTIYQILIELNFLLPEIVQKLIGIVKSSASLSATKLSASDASSDLLWIPSIIYLRKISNPDNFANFIKMILSKQDFSLQLEKEPLAESIQIRRHSYAQGLEPNAVSTISRNSSFSFSRASFPASNTENDTSTELNEIFEALKKGIRDVKFKNLKKIYQGMNKASKYLLLKKIDKSGNTLMHIACEGPYTHPKFQHKYYEFSLEEIASIEKPYLLIIEWLLSLGASSTTTNSEKELPLHVAIRERSLAIIQKLLEITPTENLTAVDSEGANIIHLAVSREKHASQILKLVINEVSKRTNSSVLLNTLLMAEDFSGNFPLHHISAKINFADQADILTKLLDTLITTSPSSISIIINNALETPLHLAIKQLNEEVLLKLLPLFGKIINARDIHGNTPLHLYIKHLINKKSFFATNIRDSSGNSMFWMLEGLLNHGADPYELNGQAQTAIQLVEAAGLSIPWLKNYKMQEKTSFTATQLEKTIKGLLHAEQLFSNYCKIGMAHENYKVFISETDRKQDVLVYSHYHQVLSLILDSNDSSLSLPHEDIVLADIQHAKTQIKNAEKKMHDLDDLDIIIYAERIVFYNEVIRRAQMIFQIPYYRSLYQSFYQNNRELFAISTRNLMQNSFFARPTSNVRNSSLVLAAHRPASDHPTSITDDNSPPIPEGKLEI